MEYLDRTLRRLIEEALSDTPVVLVNGPRQAGKTTLVKNIQHRGSAEIVTLDDVATREAASNDPRAFVQRPVDTLVIDEVQLEPNLFRAIKAEVDRDRRAGRFLLTGSSRLLAAPGLADALVGRVETLDLWPFSQGELLGVREDFVDRLFDDPRSLPHTDDSRSDLIERVLTGGFPEAVRRPPARRRRWFDSYVTTTNQTTVREIAAIERLAEIPRLLRLCAARTGTELIVTAIASELGFPARTVDGYLTLLATAFLIHFLPAWSTNLSSKVVRRPKLVVTDSGLASHMLGMSPRAITERGVVFGQLLETFVINELRKQLGWSDNSPSLWHFRDRSGAEVDIVLEHPDGRIVGVEVKATSTPMGRDFRGLRFLEERLGDRFHFGVLLTAAPENLAFGPRLAAVSVNSLWSSASGYGPQPAGRVQRK